MEKIIDVDLVFKGLTRQPFLFGVPMIPIVIGGIIIVSIAILTHLIVALLLIPYYIALYYLTKTDEKFFSVLANAIKTTNFRRDTYNEVKTYSASPKYRKMENTKLSIYPLDKVPNLSDFIPYSTHVTKNVVLTKDNKYVATWAIDGVKFDMVEEYYFSNEKKSLNSLIRSLSSESVAIYTHSAMHSYSDKLDYNYGSQYLQDFADNYQENLEAQDLHISLKYLTIVYTPLSTSVDMKQFQKLSYSKKETKINDFLFQMNEITNRVEATFERYGAKRLGTYKDEDENGTSYSELLEFYNFLIGGVFKKVKILNTPIDEYLNGGATHLKFNKSVMQIDYSNGDKKFAKCLEIKEFCTETYIGIIDALLANQITYVITQSFVPMNKRDAKMALSLQKGRLTGSLDDGVSQILELGEALDDLISDKLSFGEYHFSIMIYGDTILEVKKHTEHMTVAIEDMGHLVTQSDIAFPATYFAQFPSNLSLRPRVTLISSLNFSAFMSFHSYLMGRRDNNCWGQAVAIMSTPSRSPYYFNLHKTEKDDDFGKFNLGNTLVIGQSGTGKTAFLSFLLNSMMKYDNDNTFPTHIEEKYRHFSAIYLDKDYGAMTNILAAGGKYITLENGEDTGFNPFMCDNTKHNKNKLQQLIKMMISSDTKIKAADDKKISDAIEFIMSQFTKEERSYPISLLLENIAEDADADISIKEKLSLWQNGEKYGWVFDNEKDNLVLEDKQIIGIDGTEFLDDTDVGSVMSFYILWRVMDLRDGKRLGIWIDEAWKWIEDENTTKEVHNSFKTNRKNNNFMVLGVQSVEDFLKNSSARAIIEQSATIALFSNPKANEDDYMTGLKCSHEEYMRVKEFNPSDFNILIKRDEGSVIATMDMSKMRKIFLKTLSTNKTDVERIREIYSSENDTLNEKFRNLEKYFKG